MLLGKRLDHDRFAHIVKESTTFKPELSHALAANRFVPDWEFVGHAECNHYDWASENFARSFRKAFGPDVPMTLLLSCHQADWDNYPKYLKSKPWLPNVTITKTPSYFEFAREGDADKNDYYVLFLSENQALSKICFELFI